MFHKDSHLHFLDVKPALTGWFQVSLKELKIKNVTSVKLTMKKKEL